jgi:hypothetical protein
VWSLKESTFDQHAIKGIFMGRRTGNKEVVAKLEDALTVFLADQRKSAENDPE